MKRVPFLRAALLGAVLAGAAMLHAAPPIPVKPAGTPAPAAAVKHPPDCTSCHREDGWNRVTFDHDSTRMPLRDGHADVNCRVCHQQVKTLTLDTACQSCHQDIHQGRLGKACQQCHDQRSFRSGAGVEAHGQTRFPLFARHASIPCDKCHQARGDRTFQGVSVRCEGCHEENAARTRGQDVDHATLGPQPDCRACHSQVNWKPARLDGHDRCFGITAGDHSRFSCRDCHARIPGLQVNACNSGTASCIQCHACSHMDREHREEGVAGYQCVDRKCYECHGGAR